MKRKMIRRGQRLLDTLHESVEFLEKLRRTFHAEVSAKEI